MQIMWNKILDRTVANKHCFRLGIRVKKKLIQIAIFDIEGKLLIYNDIYVPSTCLYNDSASHIIVLTTTCCQLPQRNTMRA